MLCIVRIVHLEGINFDFFKKSWKSVEHTSLVRTTVLRICSYLHLGKHFSGHNKFFLSYLRRHSGFIVVWSDWMLYSEIPQSHMVSSHFTDGKWRHTTLYHLFKGCLVEKVKENLGCHSFYSTALWKIFLGKNYILCS
jgi:hypothetical protein